MNDADLNTDVLDVIRRRWDTSHEKGAHDYTDEGCRILAERAFKDVSILLAALDRLVNERDQARHLAQSHHGDVIRAKAALQDIRHLVELEIGRRILEGTMSSSALKENT